MPTHTRTHVHVTFANPHLTCESCEQPVTSWHNNDACGCDSLCWNVPCRHVADTRNTCPSWDPVDGCQCLEHLGHVPHPPAQADEETR
ncbi:hypothetical protein [Streptomyces sp. NPDC054975]